MPKRPSRYRDAIVGHIYIDGASEAIEFYKTAFGAEELFRVVGEDGKIIHAEITVCGSSAMISDLTDKRYGDPRALGATTVCMHIFSDDNVALFRRAIGAGAEEILPPTDTYFGANSATLRDPYGHVWALLTWNEDLSVDEIEARATAALSSANHSRPR